jgi:hypothetical protein
MEENTRKLLRNFAIELVLYAVLVVVYFLVVLRVLGEPLFDLYHNRPVLYAAAALLLILAQGVALEYVTSLLIRMLGLERLE